MSYRLFVFGTLKQDFPNFATNNGARIDGAFVTVDRYPLYLVGDRYSPWLLDAAGEGEHVVGEVFEVGDAALKAMDELERVGEPDGYRRRTIRVDKLEGGSRLTVQAYFKPKDHLVASDARVGPLKAYTLEHAKLYSRRATG
jgi:gamma-glutamylaminecyclotransferase